MSSARSTPQGSGRIYRHYARRVRELLGRFDEIRELIKHEGAKGTRIEQALRDILAAYLPAAYARGSGFVIDSFGGEADMSRQEDILLVDTVFSHRLFADENEPDLYPVETLYSAIEVKTSVDAGELKSAVANIASVKRLRSIPRISGPPNTVLFRAVPDTPPVGVIFAFDSTSSSIDTLMRQCVAACDTVEPNVRPDIVCVLNRGYLALPATRGPHHDVYGLLRTGPSGLTEIVETTEQTDDEAIVDKQRYPIVSLNGYRLLADPARTFMGFLHHFAFHLRHREIPPFSTLLPHYVPPRLQQSIQLKWIQDGGQ